MLSITENPPLEHYILIHLHIITVTINAFALLKPMPYNTTQCKLTSSGESTKNLLNYKQTMQRYELINNGSGDAETMQSDQENSWILEKQVTIFTLSSV